MNICCQSKVLSLRINCRIIESQSIRRSGYNLTFATFTVYRYLTVICISDNTIILRIRTGTVCGYSPDSLCLIHYCHLCGTFSGDVLSSDCYYGYGIHIAHCKTTYSCCGSGTLCFIIRSFYSHYVFLSFFYFAPFQCHGTFSYIRSAGDLRCSQWKYEICVHAVARLVLFSVTDCFYRKSISSGCCGGKAYDCLVAFLGRLRSSDNASFCIAHSDFDLVRAVVTDVGLYGHIHFTGILYRADNLRVLYSRPVCAGRLLCAACGLCYDYFKNVVIILQTSQVISSSLCYFQYRNAGCIFRQGLSCLRHHGSASGKQCHLAVVVSAFHPVHFNFCSSGGLEAYSVFIIGNIQFSSQIDSLGECRSIFKALLTAIYLRF